MAGLVPVNVWQGLGNIVRCLECGAGSMRRGLLTKEHMESHGLTRVEYLAKHPEHAEARYWGVATCYLEARKAFQRDIQKAEELRNSWNLESSSVTQDAPLEATCPARRR